MGTVGLAVIVVMWIGYAGLVVAAVSWVRQRAD
jgi:hypothetical protein